jgi:acetate kinase
MKVLTLNSGSSSLKFKLYDANGLGLLAGGLAERLGTGQGRLALRWRDGHGGWQMREQAQGADTHAAALEGAFAELARVGVLQGRRELVAVGHRVVHGGEHFTAPTLIDGGTLAQIRAAEHLAPLHNPANLRGIDLARRIFPDVPQVAVFDTAFHHTLPPHVSHYALPLGLYEEFHVRRYGFHGISVQYVTRRAAALMDRPPAGLNTIVLHLGNGASVTAVAGGRSVETSMGMTPLEGLMMGTRCGDLDPAVHFHLLRYTRRSPAQLEDLLYHASGLKGVCGHSDMREVHALARQGDKAAGLALDMFCHRLKKYIGAYAAVLGRVDAVVFTAGIGENDAEVRARSLAGLDNLGIVIDAARNRASGCDARPLHASESRTQVWVIPTDEELEIARCALECLTHDETQGATP